MVSTAEELVSVELSLALAGDALSSAYSFQQIGQYLSSLSSLRANILGRGKDVKISSAVCEGGLGPKKTG